MEPPNPRHPEKPRLAIPGPNDWYTFATTPKSLPFRSILTAVATDGVNEYQTDWCWKLQSCGSPGSVEVPFRSPLSANGNDEIACSFAKRSLLGGDADAGPAVTKARDAKTRSAGTASKHRPRCGARQGYGTSTFIGPPCSDAGRHPRPKSTTP
jgi:hypothetical protein